MVATFAFAAAAQAALCLQDVFAPEVTGVPPTYAHREMCRMDDGEIRHYGQVMRADVVLRRGTRASAGGCFPRRRTTSARSSGARGRASG